MGSRTILLADRHTDSRIVYSALLQHGGFVVLEACDGVEALEMVPDHTPDAIITELTLPVIDGFELLRRLKQQPLTAHIQVIIVTADSRPDMRREAEDAGCDAFVLKPCTPRRLLQITRGVLDRREIPSILTRGSTSD